MKVIHITSVHVPFDTRIFFKECASLREAGYRVHLIAGYERDEIVDGIEIHAIRSRKNKYARFFLSTLAVLNKALNEKYDVYHIHDPELIPAGLFIKLITRGKVVYDVHEDYSQHILDKGWLGPKWFRKIISFIYRFFEKQASNFFDGIVTVSEEFNRNFDENKTHIVKNYVSLKFLDSIEPKENPKEIFKAVYLGDLSRNRGIFECISAMEILGGKAELLLMGKWGSDAFHQDCLNNPGWKYTKYLGNLRLEDAYGYLKTADAGLHCIYPSDYFLRGLPTKLFEYGACGLPVIMTYSEFWEKEFGEFVLFTSPEPDKIALRLEELIENPERKRTLGQKGRKIIEGNYCWENESIKLIQLYKSFEKNNRS